jgi:hypothetical protein
MIGWIMKNLVANDTYDARAAGFIHSAVKMESSQSGMSRSIPANWKLRVHIYRSPPTIKHDLEGRVVQITNKDKLICGRYHNIWQRDVYRFWIGRGIRNLITVWFELSDTQKLWYCEVSCWFSNIDSRATSKEKRKPVRHFRGHLYLKGGSDIVTIIYANTGSQ